MSQLAFLQRECLDRCPAGKPGKLHERIRVAALM